MHAASSLVSRVVADDLRLGDLTLIAPSFGSFPTIYAGTAECGNGSCTTSPLHPQLADYACSVGTVQADEPGQE